MIEEMGKIEISGDIVIRQTVHKQSWFIHDNICDEEIEVTLDELDGLACYSPIVQMLIQGAQLALAELDRIGGDIGFEPDRYRERIMATDVLSRAVRDVEEVVSEGLK